MPRRATALMSPGKRPQTPPLSFDLSMVFLFTTNKITALVLSSHRLKIVMFYKARS